jgi:transcriptional regulator with XRE-family HTH domain
MASLNERIGEAIKRKRQRDRLTQAELGSKIGVSGSYIGAVESGSTSIRITELEGVAVCLRTTALDLINEVAGRDEYKFTSANRERDAFMTLYDGLSPDNQRMARSFLLFLRQEQSDADDRATT